LAIIAGANNYNFLARTAYSDRALHISQGESSERRDVCKWLDAQRLGGDDIHNGGITLLDEFGVFFDDFSRSAIQLCQDFGELASNVRRVTVCVAEQENAGVWLGHMRREAGLGCFIART